LYPFTNVLLKFVTNKLDKINKKINELKFTNYSNRDIDFYKEYSNYNYHNLNEIQIKKYKSLICADKLYKMDYKIIEEKFK